MRKIALIFANISNKLHAKYEWAKNLNWEKKYLWLCIFTNKILNVNILAFDLEDKKSCVGGGDS